MLRHMRPDRAALTRFWQEHGLALLLYAALSIAISWPTAANFTSRITSDGIDAKHNLWIFWHTTQALLGRQPLYDAPLLYYPQGITLLVHGVGPLTSLFALPFWPLGPEAAYNGALLVGLTLTGYCMYLLARGLGFARGVALVAGLLLLSSTMVLAGLNSHVTKVFLGALPLTLLAFHHTLDPRRSPWWALATALALLLTPLHTGYQFVFACFALAFFGLAALLAAAPNERWPLLRRIALAGAAVLLVVGPLLVAILRAAGSTVIDVNVNRDSFAAPDLALYLLPADFSLLFGNITRSVLQPYTRQIALDIETAVALSFAGLALCAVAFFWGRRPARRWLLFALLCVLLSLGPSLRLLGQQRFTEYDLPIILPYAFMTGLPGLDFMRAPGRWMMLGFVALAGAACFGLEALVVRWPRWQRAIIGAAAALVLLQAWPQPFPQETLPPVPAFYTQLAQDNAIYGVFDLPLKAAPGLAYNGWSYIHTSSFHQVYQMTHGKGIVAGYISRTYSRHPRFGELLSDLPTALAVDGHSSKYVNFQDDLARAGYRYVVWHKTLDRYIREDAAPGQRSAQELLEEVYGPQTPLVDDELTRVYPVKPTGTLQLRAGAGWRFPEQQWRWAASPATLEVSSPEAQPAMLQITPAFIHDPAGTEGLGPTGSLDVQVGASFRTTVQISADQTTTVPIPLAAGTQAITLTLAAGNFRPAAYGEGADEPLSFAVRAINLQSRAGFALPEDLLVDGSAQQDGTATLVATHGSGWYAYEPENQSRWASSPAELLIYSPAAQRVRISLRLNTLYNGSDGLGEAGTLLIDDGGGGAPLRHPVRVGQPLAAELQLRPGWNRVTLALEAGNFQPSALFAGNGDQRLLSFVVGALEITTRP